MEEDIKVLEKYSKNIPCDSCKYCAERPRIAQAIENLINRNKELEEQRDSLMWQRNTIDIPKIEELEQKLNFQNEKQDIIKILQELLEERR